MSGYLVRRALNAIPLLLFVSMAVFALTHLSGDPVEAIVGGGEVASNPELEARIRHDLGLDDPLPVQYLNWLKGVLRGDLGRSIQTHQPVREALADRLPTTLQLALAAWAIGILISLPLGVIAAVRQNTWVDHGATVLALSGVAIPSFWMGLMFILFFGVWADILPPSGFVSITDDPLKALQYLILPAVTLGVHQTGSLTRQMRSAMVEVLNQDYVRTARAKGLVERSVIIRHGVRNAMLPVLTVLGLQAGALVGGTVVVEQVFAIPGMGRLALTAVLAHDIPVVQGFVLVATLAVVTANLVTDVMYGVLDPRIHYGR
ncbi:MAG TPA: ABC transporter permease [Tepidiformaceae bacterium]|jgi:peptide/nickel transport system permease protein|nr:ABC transporter permease [Tepidiformaceae bacterium]